MFSYNLEQNDVFSVGNEENTSFFFMNGILCHKILYFCFANQCFCENGEAASSTGCANHESLTCVYCEAGYTLIDNACHSNVCNCENGVGSLGVNCLIMDSFHCDSCETFYNLQAESCVVNQCTVRSKFYLQ